MAIDNKVTTIVDVKCFYCPQRLNITTDRPLEAANELTDFIADKAKYFGWCYIANNDFHEDVFRCPRHI